MKRRFLLINIAMSISTEPLQLPAFDQIGRETVGPKDGQVTLLVNRSYLVQLPVLNATQKPTS